MGPDRDVRGFTLIELVLVIILLGVIAGIALPRYESVQSNARAAAIKGELGAIRAAVFIQYARRNLQQLAPAYPTLTGAIFSDGLVPRDPVRLSRAVKTTAGLNNVGGWQYLQASGRVKCNL